VRRIEHTVRIWNITPKIPVDVDRDIETRNAIPTSTYRAALLARIARIMLVLDSTPVCMRLSRLGPTNWWRDQTLYAMASVAKRLKVMVVI
jgi:hypothetical protein